MLKQLFSQHVLANLVFGLVLIVGLLSYQQLPRQRDPTINFNWIQVHTYYPGASSYDVEQQITIPLEDAIAKVSDIRFVSSNSGESVSSILVRFHELDEFSFDKRVNDLRREIQIIENREFPAGVESPIINELTTANAWPSAALVITAPADDEQLRKYTYQIQQDLARMSQVEKTTTLSLEDPELQVLFDPHQLQSLGISPTTVSNSVSGLFKDSAAGKLAIGDEQWLVRFAGTHADPEYLAQLPILTDQGEITLGRIANIQRNHAPKRELARFNGQPATVIYIMKKADTNTLALLDQLRVYVAENNARRASQGLQITIADDQSHSTNQAIGIMQTNALLGLLMVLLVTWIFLGSRIAILTSIGIPFTLAGTFIVLSFTGHTLNNSVLLGIVISLGMIVDDAVVVVESIYARLQKGMDQIPAAIDALREVFTPVSASVLTTMAAFLPLMLLPGVLGKFMLVIPLVVTIALCISLLEAYWMLPTHIHAFNVNFKNPSKLQRYRNRLTHNIRIQYGRILAKTLRWPRTLLSGVFLLFVLALLAVSFKLIKVDFFAMDATRILFVNVQMPEGTKLEKTMQVVTQAEQIVQQHLAPEARSILQYAGLMNTETEPLMGDHVGQIMISLNPQSDGDRNIEKLIAPLKIDLKEIPGPDQIYLFRVKDGPPASKAISLKVRGEQYSQIREVSNRLRQFMQSQAIYVEVGDNDSHGQAQMVLTPNLDAIRRAGIPPTDIMRITRLLTDGEIAARMHHAGEALEVRIKAQWPRSDDIERLLDFPIPAQDLTLIPLRALVDVQLSAANGNIRRYNFRRAITVEADIDKSLTDTVAANQKLNKYWDSIKQEYPKVDLDFSGELDDIQESLNSIVILFILGIGLIYVILGTQFNSYWQPFIILVTVPMAFTGVVAGLLLTANPLSLYTLYGVVALAGISVNAAIVMISKANQLVHQGFSLIHATVYAARRRVVPILITSLTTIAGLFGLATGLGGKSLIWGPVATAIVWGLTFSTLLTLLVVPLLYNLTMRVAQRRAMRTATLNAPVN